MIHSCRAHYKGKTIHRNTRVYIYCKSITCSHLLELNVFIKNKFILLLFPGQLFSLDLFLSCVHDQMGQMLGHGSGSTVAITGPIHHEFMDGGRLVQAHDHTTRGTINLGVQFGVADQIHMSMASLSPKATKSILLWMRQYFSKTKMRASSMNSAVW